MVAKRHIDDCTQAVRESIKQAMQLAKSNEKNPNDFALFVADSKYEKRLEGNVNGLSPYTINNLDTHYKDEHRQEFYITYMNQNAAVLYEALPQGQKPPFFRWNTTLEVMIYTHIWESTWFLKSLKQLTNLIDGVSFDWHLERTLAKHVRSNLIRNYIENVLAAHSLNLAKLIAASYHPQIRNAFAHSDFNFGYANETEVIRFFNYRGKSGELETISHEDWHRRFATTVCLAHYLLEAILKERKRYGDACLTISFPDYKNGDQLVPRMIRHYSESDHFNFS